MPLFWLLILDNVEQPQEILAGWLPRKHEGSVLVTTRMRHMGPLAQSERLPVFSEEEGVLFLLRRAGRLAAKRSLKDAPVAEVERARELYRLMGGLPLALDQAELTSQRMGARLSDILSCIDKLAQSCWRVGKGRRITRIRC